MMLPTDADLDHWRSVTDQPADEAVAAYFAAIGDAAPAQLMGTLVRHIRLPPEDQVPAIAAFLAASAPPPPPAGPSTPAPTGSPMPPTAPAPD